MIQYERTDISEGIHINKSRMYVLMYKLKEYMLCHYWYFKEIGYEYEQYVCHGCHDF